MANEQNLIPGAHILTVEEQSRGGKESVKKRRLQSELLSVLDKKTNTGEYDEIFEQFGIEKESRDYAVAVACALVKKAASGDLSAIGLLRDTIGEKPKDEIDISGGVVFVSGEDDIPE